MQKIIKPWGHEIHWASTNKYVGKVLHISRGKRLSRQYHQVKDETVYVTRGLLIAEIGLKENGEPEEIKYLKTGQSLRIQPGTIHRFCAPIDGHVEVMEVSTPELNDVVRIQDDYGRT